jgi:hypothetical protein
MQIRIIIHIYYYTSREGNNLYQCGIKRFNLAGREMSTKLLCSISGRSVRGAKYGELFRGVGVEIKQFLGFKDACI